MDGYQTYYHFYLGAFLLDLETTNLLFKGDLSLVSQLHLLSFRLTVSTMLLKLKFYQFLYLEDASVYDIGWNVGLKGYLLNADLLFEKACK